MSMPSYKSRVTVSHLKVLVIFYEPACYFFLKSLLLVIFFTNLLFVIFTSLLLTVFAYNGIHIIVSGFKYFYVTFYILLLFFYIYFIFALKDFIVSVTQT